MLFVDLNVCVIFFNSNLYLDTNQTFQFAVLHSLIVRHIVHSYPRRSVQFNPSFSNMFASLYIQEEWAHTSSSALLLLYFAVYDIDNCDILPCPETPVKSHHRQNPKIDDSLAFSGMNLILILDNSGKKRSSHSFPFFLICKRMYMYYKSFFIFI